MFCGPVRVPSEASGGVAKITLSMPDWAEGKVTPGTFEGLVIGGANDVAGLEAALQVEDAVTRREIIAAIGRFGPTTPQMLDLLVRQFQDASPSYRSQVVTALSGWKGQPDAVTAALTSRLEDEDNDVRSAAIRALEFRRQQALAAAAGAKQD